ncbi:hypothetical protein A2592_03780 [Candidatus Kaiserbacteria bacterium RIFOXYD1_FULL_42_15]|uniref:Uncharacterized protein n=1 Tax=Candidatus Kaiserbacteria bacterium RIFOXYD1_FULL_42_15 TaxID=1798532 RepID=A0A1F6FQA9_9BACT|nr:MAG: hypothetical protein A2592_03780 [Candidatus Kaiserbacteria bacterium RIFOXYD1_FULL_42_15]
MDVQFNDENSQIKNPNSRVKTGFISTFLIRTGLVSDENGAQKIMLGIIILSLITFIYLWWPNTSDKELTPIQIEQAGNQNEIQSN